MQIVQNGEIYLWNIEGNYHLQNAFLLKYFLLVVDKDRMLVSSVAVYQHIHSYILSVPGKCFPPTCR